MLGPIDSGIIFAYLALMIAIGVYASRRQDSVEEAWRIVDGILDDTTPIHPYPVGSWGPTTAGAMLPRGHCWPEDE